MNNNEREKFGSRLGFLLISAGCAIGLGNIWRFPYITGQNGGAIFVLIYLALLFLIGVPIVTMELAIGRASHSSIGYSYEILTPGKRKWHYSKYAQIIANYVLMGFYTMVTGWMLYYTYKVCNGDFISSAVTEQVSGGYFGQMLEDYKTQILVTVTVTVLGFFVCALGLRKGVERFTKPLMISLFALLAFLAAHSVFLDGFKEGISFYLYPDFSNLKNIDLTEAFYAALGQAFFTLGIGVGSLQIFGSYMDKRKSIANEAILIAVLDTSVAILAGLVIFPACFSFGVAPGQGPGLTFVTMTSIFSNMPMGTLWGGLFFLFMFMAAFSTLIAVFENIVGISMDLFGCRRIKAVVVNCAVIIALSLPVILGFNVLSDFHPMGGNSVVLDLYDFILSQNLIEFGSIIYILYVSYKFGWGFDNYLKEVNTGTGLKVSPLWKNYFKFVLPVVIVFLVVQGYFSVFGK